MNMGQHSGTHAVPYNSLVLTIIHFRANNFGHNLCDGKNHTITLNQLKSSEHIMLNRFSKTLPLLGVTSMSSLHPLLLEASISTSLLLLSPPLQLLQLQLAHWKLMVLKHLLDAFEVNPCCTWRCESIA